VATVTDAEEVVARSTTDEETVSVDRRNTPSHLDDLRANNGSSNGYNRPKRENSLLYSVDFVHNADITNPSSLAFNQPPVNVGAVGPT
jgi:hypothetical protein